jgi:hypothetical protein
MPSHVRVTQNGDSHAIGRARLRLKLAALAYTNSRHGIDADPGLSRAGLQVMCLAAIQYYEALTGADPAKRPVDPSLQLDAGDW